MFDQLIGNDRVKELLCRQLAAGRIANAFLFAGPEGVGKRQFALGLSQSFVCMSPTDGEACGECGACRRAVVFDIPKSENKDDYKQVFFSQHPDVGIVVPFRNNVLIDAIRGLEAEANFLPYEARGRIFIIDDADKMNAPASNALLKTLEEPSASSHIILVSSRPERLLQTIRSRCQVIRFAPVEAKEIERFLAASERFAPEDAALAARVSAGSVGRALGLDIEAFKASRELMLGVLRSALVRPDLAAVLQVSELISDAKNKDRFAESFDILETLIRDIWILKNGLAVETLVNSDIAKQLGALAERAGSKMLAAWAEQIETLRENLLFNLNKRVAADALFASMAGSPGTK